MLDTAAIVMSHGKNIALEYAEGVNDNMCQSHFHEFYELYYLISGERIHMIESEVYHIKANSFVLFPPRTMHHSYGEKDVPFKRIVLYFTPDMITSESARNLLSQKVRIFSSKNQRTSPVYYVLKSIDQELRSEESFHEEYAAATLNQLAFTILRLHFPSVQSTPKTRPAQAVSYIHQHYGEEISVQDLASMLYVSPYYLCHEFKKATGKTIIQYLNITRILHAQRLLLETEKNITQISKEVGFSNITHFNRIFKSITGVSPREKRKEYKARTALSLTAVRNEVKKNPAKQDSPPGLGRFSDITPLQPSAFLPGGLFVLL